MPLKVIVLIVQKMFFQVTRTRRNERPTCLHIFGVVKYRNRVAKMSRNEGLCVQQYTQKSSI